MLMAPKGDLEKLHFAQKSDFAHYEHAKTEACRRPNHSCRPGHLYFTRLYGSRGWQFYSWVISQIIAVSEPGPILDIGAGLGLLTECASRWGLDCQGLEVSQEAIDMAISRNSNLRLGHCDLNDALPLANGSFQTVVLNQVICCLEPRLVLTVLRESHRVLCDGGVIFIQSPSRYNKQVIRRDPTIINPTSPSELRKHLMMCGFQDIVPFDAPMPLLGQSRFALLIVKALFRVTKWDRLSATASCWARKPRSQGGAHSLTFVT
jgi:SAM-dependent methyltransferase